MGANYQVGFLTLHPQFSKGMVSDQRLRILGPDGHPAYTVNIRIDLTRFGIVGGLMQCPCVPGNGDPPFRKIGHPPPDPQVPHIRLRKLEYELRRLEGRDHGLSGLDLCAVGKPYSFCAPVLNQDLLHLLLNIALSSILNETLIGSMSSCMSPPVGAAIIKMNHHGEKKHEPRPVEIRRNPKRAMGNPEEPSH